MKPNTIKIDEVEYVRADSLTQKQHGDLKIVVLDRGFVYVGATKVDGDFLVITNARNIRRWGTTKGLVELCDGPTPSTVVDKAFEEIIAPLRAVIAIHSVNNSARW